MKSVASDIDSATPGPVQLAKAYRERGWKPVRLNGKAPADAEWPAVAEAEQIAVEDFAGHNVGVLLGAASGDLADIDLDCQEALDLAPYFLPETLTFGRESCRGAHRLYRSAGARTARFLDDAAGVLLELRANRSDGSSGLQTMFPGSVHPCGEVLAFDNECEPAEIEYGDLRWRVQRLALACVLRRGWLPEGGRRNDKSMALPGGLLKAGWKPEEVLELLQAVRECSGCDREKDAATVQSAIGRFLEGGEVKGFGSLVAEGVLTEVEVKTIERLARTPEEERHLAGLALTAAGSVDLRRERLLARLDTDRDTRAYIRADAYDDRALAQLSPAPANDVPAIASEPTPDPKAARWADSFTEWDLQVDPPPINWVVPALEIGPGRPCATVGYSNDGKTTITQQALFDVAMGRRLFGAFAVRQGAVLHIDYEAGGAYGGIVLENYARLCRGHGVDRRELAQQLRVVRANKFLTEDDAKDWLSWMTEDFDYCVIDALVAACPGADENKVAEISPPLYMLERVSASTGCAIHIIHHEVKPTNGKAPEARYAIRGSSSIHGALSAALTIRPTEDANVREVSCAKKPRMGFESFGLRFVDVPNPDAKTPGQALASGGASWGLRIERAALPEDAGARDHRETVGKRADLIEGVLRERAGQFGEPMTYTQLRGVTGLNGERWPEALAECLRRGSVREDAGKRKGSLCYAWVAPDERRRADVNQGPRAFRGPQGPGGGG